MTDILLGRPSNVSKSGDVNGDCHVRKNPVEMQGVLAHTKYENSLMSKIVKS